MKYTIIYYGSHWTVNRKLVEVEILNIENLGVPSGDIIFIFEGWCRHEGESEEEMLQLVD